MDRCSICPAKYPIIQGHGPKPSSYFACGERPGRNELANGIPFIGDAGQEWDNTYLPRAGLSRPEVYVTNTVKCYADQNRKPTQEEIKVCGDYHLPEELDRVQPTIIFLMGSTACSLVDGINLDIEHGIPRRGQLFGQEYWLVPMYHPALGLHKTSKMIDILQDWEGLKGWIEEDKWTWLEDDGKTDYKLIERSSDIDDYVPFSGIPLTGIDTESHQGQFFSIQFSWKPGTGRMIMADNLKMLDEWAKLQRSLMSKHTDKNHVRQPECKSLVYHYAPADLEMTEQVIGKKNIPYRDTLTEAYNLGMWPGNNGLKSLGYRLCGVRMKSWEDLVTEPSKGKLLEWMMEQIEVEAANPIVIEKQLKTKLKITQKANGVESALRRIMRHCVESTTYDPWERLEGLGLLGYPMKGIKHCRLEDVVNYGCMDADITLRVAMKLDKLREEFKDECRVQDEDCDQLQLELSNQ